MAGRYGHGVAARAVVASLRLYQRWVSPLLPQMCRFHPTCSEYACQSITRHGLARGAWLAAQRLCRCHPLHPGGFDPLP
jgi:putative membrane protein insertion efficiency factor